MTLSSIVLWELSKLVQLQRLTLDLESPAFREFLAHVLVFPITLKIAVQSRVSPGVAPGESCVIHVSFAPTSRGSLSGSLSITSNTSPSETQIALSGTSFGPVITLSSTAVTFSGQGVETTSGAKSIALLNIGDAALSITSIQAAGDFSTTNTCGASLPVGASCRIDITFRPTIRGTRYGTITIANNAPGNPQVITAYGVGLSAIVGLSQSALQFASQAVGTSSAAQAILLTNRGDFPLSVTRVDITGDYSQANDCVGVIPANGTCSINGVFSPTARGRRSGTLTVTDDGPGSPHAITLSGTATGPALSLFPTFVGFGNQLVSKTSLEQTLTVLNSGDGPLAISSVQTTRSQFTATSNCVTTLQPNASCSVRLTFTPTQMGVATGSVLIASNIPGSPGSVNMNGNGVNVVLTPSTLSFGSTLIGQLASLPAVLGNNTGSPLNISAIAVTGSAFSQSNDCSGQLPSGSTCIISVQFTPTSAISYAGTLTVTDNGSESPRTVMLSGSGGVPSVSGSSVRLAGEKRCGRLPR